jgi:hypothetical protein
VPQAGSQMTSVGVRRGQLDHQPDDVARRAELAVLPGAGDLAEHVFVEVALGVAVLHRHGSSRSTTLASSAGVGMVKRRPSCGARRWSRRRPACAGRGRRARRPRRTSRRGEVLEARPAQVVVGVAAPADAVVARGEDPARHRRSEPGGLVLFQRVQVVQPAQEEQVGDLLDHLERVGDAARPEGVPDLVDLTWRRRARPPGRRAMSKRFSAAGCDCRKSARARPVAAKAPSGRRSTPRCRVRRPISSSRR